MKQSLHTAVRGHVAVRGYTTTEVDVDLDWTALDPAVVVITPRDGWTCQPWEVARSLFIAAASAPLAGGWIGGGAFSLAIRGDVCSLMFEPRGPRPALITIPAGPTIDFIDHTRRVVETHSVEERATIERLIDEAIGRCLS